MRLNKKKIRMLFLSVICGWLLWNTGGVLTSEASSGSGETGILGMGSCGESASWTLTEDGTLSISGTGEMDNWDSRQSPWDDFLTSVKRVEIADGITSIGDYGLAQCSNLISVTIPNSVMSIGESAFSRCDSLAEITIPGSVAAIEDFAFYECDKLKSVTILEGLCTIGEYAFSRCDNLNNIIIPEGTQSIDNNAFSYCDGLEEITIPDSVNSIALGAFRSCDNLMAVAIPKGITRIESSTFHSCKNLRSVILPDSLESIGGFAFEGCSNLDGIVIPENVSEIETGAFYKCSSLSSIKMPVQVTKTGTGIFQDCSNLKSVTLSPSLISIEAQTFEGCSSLTEVILPDLITSIAYDAFRDCSSLASINIPDGVTEIGAYAFQDCSSLASIRIPDSVTEIHGSIFNGCSNLKSVTLSSGLTVIESYMFQGCSSLTKIILPPNIANIGYGAFKDCGSLENIWIPKSVTEIGGSAFNGCSKLKDVYYEGDENDWSDMNISNGNAELTDVNIHYKSSYPIKFSPSQDVWGFTNFDFGPEEDGYYITADDYIRLVSQLDEVQKQIIEEDFGKKRYNVGGNLTNVTEHIGSCHGMSAWVCLNAAHMLNPSDIDGTKNTLSQYTLKENENTDAESAVNFYFHQQHLTALQNACHDFVSMGQLEQQVSALEEMAESASQGDNLVLLWYNWYDKFNADGTCDTAETKGHMVVGYGLETGDYSEIVQKLMEDQNRKDCVEAYQFDHRVRVYDCAYPDGSKEFKENAKDAFYLYYSKDYSVWCIPAYGIVSTSNQSPYSRFNNGKLVLATNDMELLNAVDYNTGNISSYVKDTQATQAGKILTIRDASVTRKISWGSFSADIRGFSALNDTSNGQVHVITNAGIAASNGGDAESVVFLPEADDYTISTDEGEIAFQLNSGNYLTTAMANAAGTAKFPANGGVTVNTLIPAEHDISLTVNKEYQTIPWDTIDIHGEDMSMISAGMTEEGIIVTGDNLSDVTICGNNDETEEIKFSTDEDSVLITESGDGVAALVDEDKDGVFETDISNTEEHVHTYGEPEFNWTGDYMACTAVFTCEAGDDEQTAGCQVTVDTTGATCTEPGKTVYTAKVLFMEKEYVDTKEVEIPAKGHQYENGECIYCGAKESEQLPYTDVYADDWFYNSVAYAYEHGIMTGKAPTIFAPYEPLARAQFAIILHRMNGTPAIEYTGRFLDVGAADWYKDAVLWAADTGVVTGYSNGCFGPADNINREQMAVMMFRYANYKQYETSVRADFSGYLDAGSVSGFAKEAMQWAVAEGIITGKYGQTMLEPQGNASRAECATIMMRFMEKYEK